MKRMRIGALAALLCVSALGVSPVLSGCFQSSPSTTAPPAGGPPDGLPALPPDPRGGGQMGQMGPSVGGASSKPVGVATLPAKPVAGSALNKFFPNGVTFTQEKSGTVVAEIKKGATLTIADLAANPSARDKYKSSSTSVSGYPAVAVGGNGTAILVGDRYQVQVRSNDGSISESERASWLAKVKLAELEGLK